MWSSRSFSLDEIDRCNHRLKRGLRTVEKTTAMSKPSRTLLLFLACAFYVSDELARSFSYSGRSLPLVVVVIVADRKPLAAFPTKLSVLNIPPRWKFRRAVSRDSDKKSLCSAIVALSCRKN